MASSSSNAPLFGLAQNPKSEYRNSKQTRINPKSKIRNMSQGVSNFVLGICFGFGASNFGFRVADFGFFGKATFTRAFLLSPRPGVVRGGVSPGGSVRRCRGRRADGRRWPRNHGNGRGSDSKR